MSARSSAAVSTVSNDPLTVAMRAAEPSAVALFAIEIRRSTGASAFLGDAQIALDAAVADGVADLGLLDHLDQLARAQRHGRDRDGAQLSTANHSATSIGLFGVV